PTAAASDRPEVSRVLQPCALRSAPPNAIWLAILRAPVTSPGASNCPGTRGTAVSCPAPLPLPHPEQLQDGRLARRPSLTPRRAVRAWAGQRSGPGRLP